MSAVTIEFSQPLAVRGEAARRPRLALVIPIFKHSVLVSEAINAAIREAERSNGVIILVNDGCPYPETDETCLTFSMSRPDIVDYIKTPNGGLSAARNRGIRFAFARYPSIEAIYLLDADNRLGAGAMRRALAKMDETGADWVYPNIDKFGLEHNVDFSAPYNPLQHLFQNICEAGSLVHRRVFDAGVFFDETMRQGYEDWEFWLQGLEAGFRGAPCADFGLQYRARRESMVRNSDRDGEAIIAQMRKKHKKLFSPRALLGEEHRLAPRYCVVDSAKRRFAFTSIAGQASNAGDVVDLDTHFWGNHHYPAHYHFPNFVVFIDQRILQELLRLKLADAIFWQIEDALEQHGILIATLESLADGISLSPASPEQYEDVIGSGVHILAIQKNLLTACVLDPYTSWIETIRSNAPEPNAAALRLAAPFQSSILKRHGVALQVEFFFQFFHQLRNSPHHRDQQPSWEWRVNDGVIVSTDLYQRVRNYLGGFAPIARVSHSQQKEIAFLLPIVSFGGVEQVGIAVAARFKAAGWRTRLVVTERNEVRAPARLLDVFDTITFLNDASYAGWVPTHLKYFGQDLYTWPIWGNHGRLSGLLTGCDAVMILQANHGYEVMGWLRRQGAVIINSLHLLDRDSFNTPIGHPYVTLAYEHAFDIVCAPARTLLDFCSAAGMPQEKLVYLANAPSFTVSDNFRALRAEQLDAMSLPTAPPRKLRVLYLGRRDRQKGGERLTALVDCARASDLPIEWRFVGGQVVDDGQGREEGLIFEPPVFDRAAIMERLVWADVVILLSRWEGSPLIILEAQSLGAIPIATDTGGVCEMIDDGKDGYIIPNSGLNEVVATSLSRLTRLADSPVLRAKIGINALARASNLTWENTAAGLLEKVERIIEKQAA